MSRLRVVLLVWLGLFLIAAECAIERPHDSAPPKAKDETAERVARLIAQLGSPTFAERERATQALEKIGVPALPALREATRQADPEVRRRAGDLVERIENSLEALALTYREQGLPVPSAETPLILCTTTYSGRESHLAILLRLGDEQEAPQELLQGFLRLRFEPWNKVERTPVNPTDLSDKEVEALLGRIKLWPGDALALAIQCKARGWDALAHRLFHFPREKAEKTPPRKVLRQACWQFWWEELREPKSDWTAVRKRLRALMAADKDLDTKENRELLVSLDETLASSKAKPGSIEALIDDLLQAQYDHWKADDRTDPLVEKGFTAVPHLINHLGDNRLTRYLWSQGGITGVPAPPCYYRVGDLAGEALGRISGGIVDRRSSRVEVDAWWASARKVGEEKYWVGHILPEDAAPEGALMMQEPDWNLISLIGKKYPQRLGGLYRKVLKDRPDISSDSLADTIAKSSLPLQTKVALLATGTRHKAATHRGAAVGALHDLSHALPAERLVESLMKLPAVPQQVTDTGPVESAFAVMVTWSDDPRVWAALEKTARRSGVGLRLEYLEWVARAAAESPRRNLRLAFLTAFLDDLTVRDLNRHVKWNTAFAAANEFRQMGVRNYAAMSIARMLGLGTAPKPEWGEAEWTTLRRKVREALPRTP